MLLLTLSRSSASSAHGFDPGIDWEIDAAPADLPARVQFDALHHWSTRIESGVILLGLVVAYLTARSLP